MHTFSPLPPVARLSRLQPRSRRLVWALLPVFLGLVACGGKPPEAAPAAVRPVQTLTVGSAPVSAAELGFAADIRPRTEARMAFRVGGKIAQRMVDLGAPVQAGQALFRLDVADLQLGANAAAAQTAAAKANDELAQTDLKRVQQLAEQGFVSAGRLEQAQTQAKASRAALDAAQASAAVQANAAQYATLRADAAGVVTALDAEVGQVVAAGTPILRVAQGDAKDVVFHVPESAAASLARLRGSQVMVRLWSQPDAPLVAVVRDVSAMADPATRTFAIKASLQDAQHKAALGATATVVLPRGLPRAAVAGRTPVGAPLLVPLAAIVQAQGQPAVWVLEGGAVKQRPVVLGAVQGDAVAVSRGLNAGETVVTAGVHTLTPGQRVKPMDSAQPAAPAPAPPATQP